LFRLGVRTSPQLYKLRLPPYLGSSTHDPFHHLRRQEHQKFDVNLFLQNGEEWLSGPGISCWSDVKYLINTPRANIWQLPQNSVITHGLATVSVDSRDALLDAEKNEANHWSWIPEEAMQLKSYFEKLQESGKIPPWMLHTRTGKITPQFGEGAERAPNDHLFPHEALVKTAVEDYILELMKIVNNPNTSDDDFIDAGNDIAHLRLLLDLFVNPPRHNQAASSKKNKSSVAFSRSYSTVTPTRILPLLGSHRELICLCVEKEMERRKRELEELELKMDEDEVAEIDFCCLGNEFPAWGYLLDLLKSDKTWH